jgi:glycosyltransferase involved in cell wall biosynthesis
MKKTPVDRDIDLSVVIPVYNEARHIKGVVETIYEKVIKTFPRSRFIIAEDGSTDGTKEILRKINKEIPFTLVSGTERKGYAAAFKDALRLTGTEWVFFGDSDGQHDPADIHTLIRERASGDIVSGYKHPRRDPAYRVIISRVFNRFVSVLFGMKIRDINSGFKLIRKEVILNVLPQVTRVRHCVMTEFVVRAHCAGYRIREIPVSHRPRMHGTSSLFTPAKLPLIILELVRDLFRIQRDCTRQGRR